MGTDKREMLVADLPSGATIIVAHPHQVVPDDKTLRTELGITRDMVVPLSKSRERPTAPEEANVATAAHAADTARRGARNTAKAGPGAVSADS